MNPRCYLFVGLLLNFSFAYSQYKDLVIHNEQIWCLNKTGTINIFNISTEKRMIIEIPSSSGYSVLAKDRHNKIAAVSKSGEVKLFDSASWSWQHLAKLKDKVFGLVFNSSNMGYAITAKGIIDLQSGQKFFSESNLNHQVHYQTEWPGCSCYFMDRNDNIWVGFGYGEWGGDMFVFDTKTKKFIMPQLHQFEIELFPVKSFFEDDLSVYVSCGLQHFLTSGCIVRFDNFKASYVLLSDSKREKISGTGRDSLFIGEYIGPATFCKNGNAIYFYSDHGIFKGDVRKNLSTISSWTKLFQPKLRWKSGQRDAIGSPMNVSELKVLDDGTIIFSSQSDGIGFYQNSTLKMVK